MTDTRLRLATDRDELAATSILVPDEEVLLAFKCDRKGKELVLTTESVICVSKSPSTTMIERTNFSSLALLSYMGANATAVAPYIDARKKEIRVEFVMGAGSEEEVEYVVAIPEENGESEDGEETTENYKAQQLAKTIFNAIFILTRTPILYEERKRSVEIVKKLLADVQMAPPPRSSPPEAATTSSSWFDAIKSVYLS